MADIPPTLTADDFLKSALSGLQDAKIEEGRKLATVLSEARELKRLSLRELDAARRRIKDARDNLIKRMGSTSVPERLGFIGEVVGEFLGIFEGSSEVTKRKQTDELFESVLAQIDERNKELKALIEKHRPVARGGIGPPIPPELPRTPRGGMGAPSTLEERGIDIGPGFFERLPPLRDLQTPDDIIPPHLEGGFLDPLSRSAPRPARDGRGGPQRLDEMTRAIEAARDANRGLGEALAEADAAAARARAGVIAHSEALGDLDESGRRLTDSFAGQTEGLGGFADIVEQAREKTGKLGDVLADVEGIGQRAFAALEGAVQQFATTGKIEWQGLARVAIQTIQDILNAQMEASQRASSFGGGILEDLFGSVFGLFGGGSAGGSGGAVPANAGFQNASAGLIAHTGGIVGGDALPRRLVDGAVLKGAARFATGGIAGLAPGEVPAILHGGEGVFTPSQMKALGMAGGGPAPAQPLAEFQVNVINNTGEPAKIQERQRTGGGRQIDVIIGEQAAKDVLRGGPLHRAIRLAFAVNPTTVTR